MAVVKFDTRELSSFPNAMEVRLPGDKRAAAGIFDTVQRRKAIIHQLGLGGMLQRKFFGVSDRDTKTLSN